MVQTPMSEFYRKPSPVGAEVSASFPSGPDGKSPPLRKERLYDIAKRSPARHPPTLVCREGAERRDYHGVRVPPTRARCGWRDGTAKSEGPADAAHASGTYRTRPS